MIRKCCWPFVLGLALLSVTATAQEAGPLSVFIDAGWAAPQNGSFQRSWTGGPGLQGGVSFRFTNWVAAQALVSYDRFPVNEEGVRDQWADWAGPEAAINTEGGEISSLTFGAEIKVSLAGDPKNVVPYLVLGGGRSRVKEAPATIEVFYQGIQYGQEATEGTTLSNTSASAGVGVDIPVRERVRVFVEARYRMVFREAEDLEHVGMRVGARFSF